MKKMVLDGKKNSDIIGYPNIQNYPAWNRKRFRIPNLCNWLIHYPKSSRFSSLFTPCGHFLRVLCNTHNYLQPDNQKGRKGQGPIHDIFKRQK